MFFFLQVCDLRRNGANLDGSKKQMQSTWTKVASSLIASSKESSYANLSLIFHEIYILELFLVK